MEFLDTDVEFLDTDVEFLDADLLKYMPITFCFSGKGLKKKNP